MLNSKEIVDFVRGLMIEDHLKEKFVKGRGLTTGIVWGFVPERLEEAKGEVAKLLNELDIHDNPWISANDLLVLKNKEMWNKLGSYEDYQALDLLIAVSNACGFIDHNIGNEMMNVLFMGEGNSIVISRYGRSIINNDEKWLEGVREVLAHVHFIIIEDEIRERLGIAK